MPVTSGDWELFKIHIFSVLDCSNSLALLAVDVQYYCICFLGDVVIAIDGDCETATIIIIVVIVAFLVEQ